MSGGWSAVAVGLSLLVVAVPIPGALAETTDPLGPAPAQHNAPCDSDSEGFYFEFSQTVHCVAWTDNEVYVCTYSPHHSALERCENAPTLVDCTVLSCPDHSSRCPLLIDLPEIDSCLETGDLVASFDAFVTGTDIEAEGYVDLYEFDFPTGGTVVLHCVMLSVQGENVNPCETAGGTFRERVATLVDESHRVPSGPSSALQLGVCEGNLTAKAAEGGVENISVATVCFP